MKIIGTAVGSNRTNLTGVNLPSAENRTSQQYTNALLANQTYQVALPGTTFYLGYTSSPVNIRPRGGVFNSYSQGTGIKLEKGFTSLEIQNPNNIPVLVQLFVGFDEFIDNRLIVDTTAQPLVAIPRCSTASSLTYIDCSDLSAQAVTDINGGTWYAISREALYIFNPDTGITLLLQLSGANSSSGASVAVIYPLTTLRYPATGDYSLSLGGATINAIVSDVYYALPRSV